jgi:hypothetical protein
MRVWLERAEHCMKQLDDAQVWFRPNTASNAIGQIQYATKLILGES